MKLSHHVAVATALVIALAAGVSAQTSMHEFHCGIDGKDYRDLTGTPCDPNAGGSTSSASAIGTAYGNAIASLLQYLLTPDPNAAARAAAEKQRQEQLKLELERQRAEAARQQRLAEARRLDEMIARLNRSLKLDGVPQVSLQLDGVPQASLKLDGIPQASLKLGDDASAGYGICGLPGVATGGARANCSQPAALAPSGLQLKIGDAATASGFQLKDARGSGPGTQAAVPTTPPPAAAVTAERAAELFAQLSPEQQQQLLDLVARMRQGDGDAKLGIPGLPGVNLNSSGEPLQTQLENGKIGLPGRTEFRNDIFDRGATTASASSPATPETPPAAGSVVSTAATSQSQTPPVDTSAPSEKVPGPPVAATVPSPPTTTPVNGAQAQLQQAVTDSQAAVAENVPERAAVDAGRVFDQGSAGTVDLRGASTTTVDPVRVKGERRAATAQPATAQHAERSTAAVPTSTAPAPPPEAKAPRDVTVPVAAARPVPASAGSSGDTVRDSETVASRNVGATCRTNVANEDPIRNSGMIKNDAYTVCDYVEEHGGEIVIQNVRYGPRAVDLIQGGQASPKPLGFGTKSFAAGPLIGLVPSDPSLSKLAGNPVKVAKAKAWIKQCIDGTLPQLRVSSTVWLNPPKCTRQTEPGGVWVLGDSSNRHYVSDYDPMALSYGGPVIDTNLGRGTTGAYEALTEMNREGLRVPFTNLDAAHNPKCETPDLPFGATAFERDGQGHGRVVTLRDREELDGYLQSHGIAACWNGVSLVTGR